MSLSVRAAVILSSISALLAYQIGDSPTLPPINWEYQIESFVTYLAIEQEAYPVNRHDMTTIDALTCISTRITELLPGVNFEDVFFNTSNIKHTQGIWNHQETTYYTIDINFVPQNIIWAGMPNADKTYKGEPYNPHQYPIPDANAKNGFNGVYQDNINCRDCFPNHDVVYLRFKDLIAEDVTSGKFLDYLVQESDCAATFEHINYAYVSFSQSAAITVGAIPPRPGHDRHLEYVWILFLLLVPVSIFLYNRVYNAGASTYWLSTYDADRVKESELTSAGVEPTFYPEEGAAEPDLDA